MRNNMKKPSGPINPKASEPIQEANINYPPSASTQRSGSGINKHLDMVTTKIVGKREERTETINR